MKHKLRILGVAAFAVLALSSVYASGASASTKWFHVNTLNAAQNLKGSQEAANVFTVDAGEVACSTADFTGALAGTITENAGGTTSETATVTPVYENCTLKGIAGTTVNMNGCDYLFHAANTVGGTNPAKVTLLCPEGKSVVVTSKVAGVTKCTITIGGPQTLGALDFENVEVGGKKRVKVTATVTGIAYGQAAGTGAGACANAAGTTNGTYTGSVVVGGFNGAEEVGGEYK